MYMYGCSVNCYDEIECVESEWNCRGWISVANANQPITAIPFNDSAAIYRNIRNIFRYNVINAIIMATQYIN